MDWFLEALKELKRYDLKARLCSNHAELIITIQIPLCEFSNHLPKDLLITGGKHVCLHTCCSLYDGDLPYALKRYRYLGAFPYIQSTFYVLQFSF